MRTFIWKELTKEEQNEALTRPAQDNSAKVEAICKDIIENIKKDGDSALLHYSKTLDKYEGESIALSEEEIERACANVDEDLKTAITTAFFNIRTFHSAQEPVHVTKETAKGISCRNMTHPIESVGLYVPGGSAPLVSTALMLATPAAIAGCSQIILCSPPPISDAIIFAASIAGVHKIYNLGGAQAIAAMAYGTETVPKVLKIFGPGNQFVTMAKKLVSEDPNGAAIDMPAGPSEVLVIADKNADPALVAADLLSQAEHGPDSQSILLSNSKTLIEKALLETQKQLEALPRKDIATKALDRSSAILCKDIDECIAISNRYAPEHLIVQTDNAEKLVPKLRNAGSIFLGAFTPESLGDYAGGTNHTLPTYGYAKTCSALGTDDYRRRYTISKATKEGIISISKTISTLADAEGLFAHKNAVTLRVQKALEK